jgi:hypothetical protein
VTLERTLLELFSSNYAESLRESKALLEKGA